MRILPVFLAVLCGAVVVSAQDTAVFSRLAQALQLYQEPPVHRDRVIEALTFEVGAWLRSGGDPAALPDALNAAAAGTPITFAVTLVDIEGDGVTESFVETNTLGVPLILFTAAGDSFPLPPYQHQIGWFRPADDADQLARLVIEDFTGDNQPEILINYVFPGASGFTVVPVVYQRSESGYDLIFTALLVNWAGTAQMIRLPEDPQQIILSYPYLYPNGFDHKLVNHPLAQQTWRWNDEANRYVFVEMNVEFVSMTSDLPATTEDRLRWGVNEGETAFRAGEYHSALAHYNEALALAWAENWTPDSTQPDWRGVAALRRAQTLLLLRENDPAPPANYAPNGLTAMQTLLASYQSDKLGELARAFLDGYGDGSSGDAVIRAIAAMQRVDLYSYFYAGTEDRALRFPVDADLLYPMAGVTAYLNRYPETAADPAGLRAALVELGFPISALTASNGDLLLQFDPEAQPNAAVPWVLTLDGDRWRAQLNRADNRDALWAEVGTF